MTSKKKSVARRLLIGVGSLLLLLALFLVEERIRGKWALDHWVRQMRAQGERFTLAEIVPSPPLPDENAAPLLVSVPMGSGLVIPLKVPNGLHYVAPGKCVATPLVGEWFATSNRRVRFTTNAFSRVRGPGRTTNSAAPLARVGVRDLGADLATASNAFATVGQALHKPALDYGLDYSQGFTLPLHDLVGQRYIAQWLRAASLHALLETNLDESLESLCLIAALNHLQTNGLLLIEQMVRNGAVQIGVGTVWEALQVDGWKDEQLAVLQAAWHSDNAAAWMARCLEMERVMGGLEIDKLAEQGPDRALAFMGTFNPPPPASTPRNLDEIIESLSELPEKFGPLFYRGIFYPVWRFAWKDQEKLDLFKRWQPLIEAARKQAAHPNWKAHGPPSTIEPDESGERNHPRDFRFFAWQLFGVSNPEAGSKAIDAETARSLAETAVALRRWKIRHGELPQSLGQLVPDLLAQVPIDPFDDQPLRYRLNTNNTFALYSAGRNGTDDGGDPKPEKPNIRATLLNGRDMVWPAPATREEIERFETEEK